MKKILLYLVAIIILFSAGIFVSTHEAIPQTELDSPSPFFEIPNIVASIAPTPTPIATATPLPQVVNLTVPFTVQAPHANWEDPYGEFCEEASVLMAVSYLQHTTIPDAPFANTALLAIKAFEEKRFGYYKDTTIKETAIILHEHFSLETIEVKKDPTIQDIKHALALGRIIIAPLAGQQIGNPFFTAPGPLYHMLVIKGYTSDGKFITNDPGTKRGADFLYDQDVIMNAIHDWRPDRNIELGEKIIIIAG